MSKGTYCGLSRLLWCGLCATLAAACADTADKNVVAQVGEARLTVSEVQMAVPMDKTGADSVQFAAQYVAQWVERQLLYEQGRISLPDIRDIELQVDDYRRRLVAQTYEAEVLAQRVGDVSDADCLAFYEANSKDLRLGGALVQGIYVKVPVGTASLETLRRWLKDLGEDKMDSMDALDAYCQQHAVAYDNFMDQWVELSRLNDPLPQHQAIDAKGLARKTYEARDDEFAYLCLVSDYRSAGEEQPYEYALPDIREMLTQQRRLVMHRQLLGDLLREGLQSGFVKIRQAD